MPQNDFRNFFVGRFIISTPRSGIASLCSEPSKAGLRLIPLKMPLVSQAPRLQPHSFSLVVCLRATFYVVAPYDMVCCAIVEHIAE